MPNWTGLITLQSLIKIHWGLLCTYHETTAPTSKQQDVNTIMCDCIKFANRRLTCLSIAFRFLRLFSMSLLNALKKKPSTTLICKKRYPWLKMHACNCYNNRFTTEPRAKCIMYGLMVYVFEFKINEYYCSHCVPSGNSHFMVLQKFWINFKELLPY